MKLKTLTPFDFINPLLAKKSVDKIKFDSFTAELEKYKTAIGLQHNQNQTEPNIVSNAMQPFIQNIGFTAEAVSQSGQSGIDLAIKKNGNVSVIIEAKKHQDRDMITKDDIHKKSFYEAMLYFFRERDRGNNSVFHIIITDFYNWFVFDSRDFDKLFWRNSRLKKIFENTFKEKSLLGDRTVDFYELVAKELPNIKANLIDDLEIECAYFNLKNDYSQKELVSIYKLLSSDCLLKEFNPNDANSLNREFYNELLYILGLEEIKEKGKKLISRAKNPQSGSFYENITEKLSQYNKSNDFEVIIKLIIIWVNRILFLKLLESQIVSWDKDNSYKFLTNEKIKDFDDLENLFFDTLAKVKSERKHKEFEFIPYLNSSLFELNLVEDEFLKISNLSDDAKMKYYSKTVVRDSGTNRKNGDVSTLAYLFEFLDAYDFGSNSGNDMFSTSSRNLINASVLGLIFEKINGYKDGSFYTPSFITMYMARESLTKSVLDKFNNYFEIEANDFDELKRYCDKHNYKSEFINKANAIINSITICDPAVGSGHFLVSALNEIIYIKYQLGLFAIKGLDIKLENDELIVSLHNEWFNYVKPKSFDNDNHKVQKLLFEEKKHIIENQLFGVDINPNSANITKLRLWIELLKNSYYDESGELVTLPNIDINIKTGNSLISRYGLSDELKINNINQEIGKYKQAVSEYKENIGSKKEVFSSIQNLKEMFRITLKAEYKITKELNDKLLEYYKEFGFDKLSNELSLKCLEWRNQNFQPQLFGDKNEKKQAKLLAKLDKLQAQINEIEKGKIYENAFEWRFEFPEVLDEKGDFAGFDIVIGNPPYIMEDDNKSAFDGLRDKPCYQGKTDIWHIFTCQGLSILKQNGLISYIAKNQWLESQSASNMRKTIYQNGNILSIIDFGTNMVFEEASQQTMIFLIQKEDKNKEHLINYKKYIINISNENIAKLLYESQDENLKITIKQIIKNYDEKANLTFSNAQNEEILQKIESLRNFEFDEKKEMIQGLIGGPDEAFIINEDELDNYTQNEKVYLKMLHTNTGKYATLDTKQYIFYISVKNFKDKNIDDYPNLKEHLLPYKSYKDIKGKDRGLEYRRETLSGQKQWYHLWWERDESFFKDGDKLVFAARTNGSNFTFTDKAFYGSRNLFFIKSDRVNLRYITALLNSKLMYFYMHERLKHTGDLLQIDKNQFMKIPIFVPNNTKSFIEIVDKLLESKKSDPKADTSVFEAKIDKLVYELYGLSDDEIAVVEGKEKDMK